MKSIVRNANDACHRLFWRAGDEWATDRVIGWWENRRGPYNALILFGLFASLSLTMLLQLAALGPDGVLFPEPFSLFIFPFALIFVNLLYTFGWIVELGLRAIGTRGLGPWLFKLGFGLTAAVHALPPSLWGFAVVAIRLGELL